MGHGEKLGTDVTTSPAISDTIGRGVVPKPPAGRKRRAFTGSQDPLEVVTGAAPTPPVRRRRVGAAQTSVQISPEVITRTSPLISSHTHTSLVTKLDELRSDFDAVGIATTKRETEDASNLARVEGELLQLKRELEQNEGVRIYFLEENLRLSGFVQKLRKDLEEETEKALCGICMDSQKDAICFPCRHLLYCSPCLETHRKQSNSCPTCRAEILTVFQCKIQESQRPTEVTRSLSREGWNARLACGPSGLGDEEET